MKDAMFLLLVVIGSACAYGSGYYNGKFHEEERQAKSRNAQIDRLRDEVDKLKEPKAATP